MFVEGDRVIYVSGVHGSAENNPLTPGDYACEGTITSGEQSSYGIMVDWDNKCSNSYSRGDLNYVIDGLKLNPNMAFRIKKRRR